MKKVLCLMLSIISIFLLINSTIYAEENKQLSELDVLVMAHYKMSSYEEGNNLWPEDVSIKSLIPLYNEKDNIVAYYLSFKDGQYCVINNNADNPDLIEYGEGGNALIDNALLHSKDSKIKIYYFCPTSIETDKETVLLKIRSHEITKYYENYPELCTENKELSRVLKECREVLNGNRSYNFINWNNMPSGRYQFNNLANIGISSSNITWAIMSDYNNIANNHCGAVCVTNMAQYFKSEGYSCTESSLLNTFVKVHSYVGNGPVMDITSGASSYFSYKGYTLSSSGVSTFALLKSAISSDKPVGMLLLDSPSSWHWVLAVGYREYLSDSSQYARIVDGWNNTCNKFYKINDGALWFFGKSYRI